jgi:hypothetical protein
MAEAGITGRAEIEIKISDTYLNDHVADQAAVINIMALTPEEAFENHSLIRTAAPRSGINGTFEPRGIKISEALDDQGVLDPDLNRGWVNKRLKGCPSHNYNREAYAIGVHHPDSVGFIRPYLTTARGIVIKG